MGLHKVNVSQGIDWVELPEADLRIQCGCPGDSVKHLIKRGLILPTEMDGIECETGPNTILLSDVSLQNGDLANLSEFPVMQMLYRQGMMLPNHPNNTGRKPLLIGSEEQIASQLEYLYRGNYGLVSREEIMEAGISQAQATEMMRLKLKFAFGKIRPSTDFVDTVILGDDPITLAGGVVLRRIKPNVFEFSHDGKSLTIDLNLDPGVPYESCYPLGHRRFEDEYFSVIHSGEGDGWDANRPAMSSIITHQGSLYLIDAGPNLVNVMSALGIGIDQVDGIFHTHAHDDHFAGLTALMRTGRRIKYYSTALVRASVSKKLSALIGMGNQFDDLFNVQDLTFDSWNNINGLGVMPLFSPHPVENNIFVFRTLWGEGYTTYAHLADIASFRVLGGMVTDDPQAPGLSQQTFERIREDYLAPCDLKKIDIGGGMIHGEAGDFRRDKSTRIVMAHRASKLTPEEKEIGSSSPFGTVDILVKGQSDGLRRQAFFYLEAHLPGVATHYLRMLVNRSVVEINPGSIILKEGETPQEMLLVLSGKVDVLRARDNLFGSLSAGSIIGDSAILDNLPASHTYRASSFVRALQIPTYLYFEVIKLNCMLDRVRRIVAMRAFLMTTDLFGESLPVTVLGRIIDAASEREFQAGDVIAGDDLEVINIIRTGSVERTEGDGNVEVLKHGRYFGEDNAVLKVPGHSQLRALELTKVVQVPGPVVAQVPALRWKIFEAYQQRQRHAVR